ncbi:RelA/SpoT family protein [Bradyrhizobium sp. CB1717]|uniref:GTP pyrophosphokinase n=1 Tax=Bradyrhizobium sp. CB1717 TaxID=3039154 RepID=UPI0024B0AC68|nr:RelA/SpoT family protein [Bradyrhizobium sp. CB1717]WFU23159.1 RelA/SpoT family protein [Bradyrhizobium sp. CB1717]
MTEDELIEKWSAERPMYEAWGDYVVARVIDQVRSQIAPLAVDLFLRLPPKPRVKADASFLEKAFYRNKSYSDPYGDITDKVGVRFVVLLTDHIRVVSDAITKCPDWDASKDRDFEYEQQQNPIQFDYAAVHYVVRCHSELSVSGHVVPAGTPCEVQIKTILQHAYSELTHDTIYKPTVEATARMKRAAAKSMALIEATNDYFQQVVDQVSESIAPSRSLSENTSRLYRKHIQLEPQPTRAEGLIVDTFEQVAGEDVAERIDRFLTSKPQIVAQLRERASRKLLFRQPSILLVYLLANEKPTATKSNWPLTPEELRPIYVDLGKAFDNY